MDHETKARLDKQAAAIRTLRTEVAELRSMLTSSAVGATPSTSALTASTGVYVPSADCVMCSQPKEAGRTALTCKPCGKRYQDGIKGEAERVTFAECGNCRAAKTNNTQMLCVPCGKSFRLWKAAQ